jgi:N-acyl-D-amino-acid deacylase
MTQRTIVKNGLLVDGLGIDSPARIADVAFVDGVITEVGSVATTPADRVIDAEGMVVTPGWVDIHTHYDAQVSWDPYLTPSSWHGVTTAVMGNCGVGFAPVRREDHDLLIELMEGVEDIPGSAMSEGITWDWESFPEYLDAIAAQKRAIDVGAQIAHGPLRAFVMRDRGVANEPANAQDIKEMAELVEQAIRAGALGFSTSRTPIHRSKSGELVPGTSAGSDELFAIGDAMSRAGHGLLQFAPEHINLLTNEWGWVREFVTRTGRPVFVNLNQSDAAPDLWREVLSNLEIAHSDGLPIYVSVAGRAIGVLMCLEGSLHPLQFHPAYNEVADLPRSERAKALNEPERRHRIINEEPPGFAEIMMGVYDKAYLVSGANIDYEPDPTNNINGIAAARGIKPIQVVLDQMCSDDGNGMLYMPFFGYNYGDLSFVEAVQQHPYTRMGLGDAGAHCGAICDGGIPTFMLTHWVRDRTRGPRLPIEHVVHRQTRQTATTFGLMDRGAIQPGLRADINVIDLENLSFTVPRMMFDFPANGRRLVQKAQGYRATFVNGVQTVENDSFTGELPGRLIRGPQSV